MNKYIWQLDSWQGDIAPRFQWKQAVLKRQVSQLQNTLEIKVLNRLLDFQGEEFTDGINASKYRSLAKVSKATATRELAALVKKGCLEKMAEGGRSTRYQLPELS